MQSYPGAKSTYLSTVPPPLTTLRGPPPEALLDFAGEELDPSAGTYKYSNSDNIVIGLMAAAARQSLYERELISEVLDPLGLGRTYLYSAPSVAEPYIHGYDTGPDGTSTPEDATNLVDFGGWAWASGGIVSTPADLNTFIRGYVGGGLFNRRVQNEQAQFVDGGSEPTGPGRNTAGLALFRYDTRCGTVFGHTGNTFGYTQFMAASRDGRRSVTMSINLQRTQKNTGQEAEVFAALRAAEEDAVCAALAPR